MAVSTNNGLVNGPVEPAYAVLTLCSGSVVKNFFWRIFFLLGTNFSGSLVFNRYRYLVKKVFVFTRLLSSQLAHL